MFVLAAVLFMPGLMAQDDINQFELSKVVSASAREMTALLSTGKNHECLQYIHPARLQAAGSDENMIKKLNAQNEKLLAEGAVIKATYYEQPSKIVRNNGELQCTIPQHTELTTAKGRVITHTALLAISKDNGKSWKFVDASNFDMASLRKLYPNLSPRITLPPKQKPSVFNKE
ncbi:hypothetical protein A3860_39350 [Niastella vici]|uniref:DUF4440 domain-containing protein n=2 Tax=Niastella vici TaxID=1703345 RepID=A0A1V9FKD6_9BACT|nr:hypothetical protein A3860_39350 [Niastella vici]